MKIVAKDIFLTLIFNILKKLHDLHNHLTLLHERMKNEYIEKLTANLHDKDEYAIHIGNLKQTLIMD